MVENKGIVKFIESDTSKISSYPASNNHSPSRYPMSTRRLDRHSRIKPSIAFSSHKLQRMVYAESRLERDALYMLEFDDSVVAYVTQPETFGYQLHGKARVYTPDILIKRKDGQYQFVEVKPEVNTKDEKFVDKFLFLQHLFDNEIGIPLCILTDSQIRLGSRISNYRHLYQALRMPAPLKEFAQLKAEFDLNGISYAELYQYCQQLALPASTPKQILAHGLLRFDITTKLSPATLLEVK